MVTLKLTFESEGKTIKRTAIITDDLTDLSTSKKNQAVDLITNSYWDGYWSLIFEDGNTQYEVEFEFDKENREPTLKPRKAITWVDDVVVDSQFVTTLKVIK